MPVGPFFADFLCRELKLVVELDGFSHDARPEQDSARDAWFAREGYQVVRFTNEQVAENCEGVTLAISEEIKMLQEKRKAKK